MYRAITARGKGGSRYAKIAPTDSLKNYKRDIAKMMSNHLPPDYALDPTKKYFLDIYVSYPKSKFMTKGGKLKRLDASNSIKALEDAIYESLKCDDKVNVDVRVGKYYNEDDEIFTLVGILETERQDRLLSIDNVNDIISGEIS